MQLCGYLFAGQMIGELPDPKTCWQLCWVASVWLLLALSVFGALFGFIGMLIAVPLAATLGVPRFVTAQYLEADFTAG